MYAKLTLGMKFNTKSFIYCLKKAIKSSHLIMNSNTQVAFRISNKEMFEAIQYEFDGFKVWQWYPEVEDMQKVIDIAVEFIEDQVQLRSGRRRYNMSDLERLY